MRVRMAQYGIAHEPYVFPLVREGKLISLEYLFSGTTKSFIYLVKFGRLRSVKDIGNISRFMDCAHSASSWRFWGTCWILQNHG